jgi:hypothetical protein
VVNACGKRLAIQETELSIIELIKILYYKIQLEFEVEIFYLFTLMFRLVLWKESGMKENYGNR